MSQEWPRSSGSYDLPNPPGSRRRAGIPRRTMTLIAAALVTGAVATFLVPLAAGNGRTMEAHRSKTPAPLFEQSSYEVPMNGRALVFFDLSGEGDYDDRLSISRLTVALEFSDPSAPETTERFTGGRTVEYVPRDYDFNVNFVPAEVGVLDLRAQTFRFTPGDVVPERVTVCPTALMGGSDGPSQTVCVNFFRSW